ncbi:MAG: methyl-accepting chemotaxis protein [Cyclobacteriaceae bacterium]
MKLTIKARLIMAFALLIALSGIIYYIGSNNAKTLNDRVTEIININVKRMNLASKIAEDVQFLTKREKDMILTSDKLLLNELVNDFDRRHADMQNRVEGLKAISDEKGVEVIEEFSSSWNQYLKNFTQIKELAVNINTDSATHLATEISRTSAREAALGSVVVIGKIVKKNEAALEEAKAATDAMYEAGDRNMLMLLVFSVIIAIAVAAWIILSIASSISKAKEALKLVSEGNLMVNIENYSQDEVGELLDYLKMMVEKLKEIISSVSVASDNIAAASEQMSSSSQQMSEGATEQAASAEEVSSSMEEMAANIQQNTDNAMQTEKIALKAAEDIQEGSSAVNATVTSMKEIASKIGIIGEIARQTNLLALNAAVEAARAGEHGKGFAVVAAEVRKLAERSQVAATEIDQVSATSVSIAEKSGKLLEQIVPDIQKTARLVQEISASSREQSTGADQVNSAIQQLNEVTQQNAASAEEIASSSEELASQAEQMRDTIGFFRLDNGSRTHNLPSSFKPKKQVKFGVKPRAADLTKASKGVDLRMENLDSEFERF